MEGKRDLADRQDEPATLPGAPGAPAAQAARPDAADAAAGRAGQAGLPWRARAAMAARRHWLVAILLAAGLVLRVLALAAYHPALIYVDTLKYLYGASPGSEPLAYTAVLRLILLAGDLGTVAAVQHVLGLAMAAVLYVVLLRRGVAPWLAALAVAPVLLDAYQLQMEQTIMADVWFEAVIVAGLAVLLWRPAVTLWTAVAAGLILGSSATVKQLGVVLVLPTVLYLLVAGGRRAIASSAALAVAFVVPILSYCSLSYARTGHFRLAHKQPSIGRLAAAADCATLKLPAAVRPLCPTPAEQARGPDWLEHSGHSPLYATPVPPGTRGRLIAALGSAVRNQQPGRVAVAIARDSVRLFAVTREPTPGLVPISRWQFQTSYPTYPPRVSIGPGNVIVVGVQHRAFTRFKFSTLKPAYGGPAQADRPIAAFLRSYQLHGGYTTGPLLALFAVTGLAGSVLALTRRGKDGRTRPLTLACLLFAGTAAVVLLAPDFYQFSWRYQLPAVITLVPAGVLGISALLSLGGPQADARKHLFGRPRARPHPGGDALDE